MHALLSLFFAPFTFAGIEFTSAFPLSLRQVEGNSWDLPPGARAVLADVPTKPFPYRPVELP